MKRFLFSRFNGIKSFRYDQFTKK